MLTIIFSIILTGFYGCNNASFLKTIKVSEPDLSVISNDIYPGKYSLKLPAGYVVGFSSAEVAVEISDHRYQSIKIINMPESYVTNRGANISGLIKKVIEQQKLNVDGVSGASYSIKAVQKAVENALIKH
jgi:hypothetical protein